MGFRQWLADRARMVPMNIAAAAIGEWLASEGVTPDQLREAAESGRPLLLEGLKQVSREDLSVARAVFGRFAHGATERDYLRILEILELTYPQHVAAISPRHLGWYRAQLDEARRWLDGSGAP